MIDEMIKNINYQNCNCQGIKTYIPKSLEHYFVPDTEIGSKLIEKLIYNISHFILINYLDYDVMKRYGEINVFEHDNNILCEILYIKPLIESNKKPSLPYNGITTTGIYTLSNLPVTCTNEKLLHI